MAQSIETETIYKEINRHAPEIMEGIKNAPVYKKKGEVAAVIANGGEVIETILADGTKETTNTAEAGDFIVTNPGGERYIVKADTFNKRYEAKDGEEGVYSAKGYCKAIENPYQEDITMEASWGEQQTGDAYCMLADTYDPITGELGGEPYIIEERAFQDTYQKA